MGSHSTQYPLLSKKISVSTVRENIGEIEVEMQDGSEYYTEEDFIKRYGNYNFFDGGDAEAQYVYKRLKADGWIK